KIRVRRHQQFGPLREGDRRIDSCDSRLFDPIIFPCCVCKENTRAPSNTPVVVVLGVADPPAPSSGSMIKVLTAASLVRFGLPGVGHKRTGVASSPVNGKISACFSASTSIDLDHTANGSLVPILVIAMGRTYDQMLRALRYAAGCRSG